MIKMKNQDGLIAYVSEDRKEEYNKLGYKKVPVTKQEQEDNKGE
ncbi:hypothetical protein [Lactobacillus hominis]|nr:hypothetical protein [Lactobacillus hominis]